MPLGARWETGEAFASEKKMGGGEAMQAASLMALNMESSSGEQRAV